MKKYLMDEKDWDIQILPLGAYESVEAMEDAYKRAAEMTDEEHAKELIGTPGYSESNTGLVVDIGFIRKGQKQIDRPATQEYDQILYSLKVAALNSFEDIEF